MEHRWRSAAHVLVLGADGRRRTDDDTARSEVVGHEAGVGGSDQAVGHVGISRHALISGIRPRHGVGLALGRTALERRCRQWRHVREEVAVGGVTEVVLDRARAHLQGEVELTIWSTDPRAIGHLRIEARARNEQHTRVGEAVRRVGDRDLVGKGQLVSAVGVGAIRPGSRGHAQWHHRGHKCRSAQSYCSPHSASKVVAPFSVFRSPAHFASLSPAAQPIREKSRARSGAK